MKIIPINFINYNHAFSDCTECTLQTRFRCKSCFGTGLFCPNCFNSGLKICNGKLTSVCDCGMYNQKAYFFEVLSLDYQHLVNIPYEYSGNISRLEDYIQVIAKESYLHRAKNQFSYTRFLFTNTREELFILARISYLQNSLNNVTSKGVLRGLIYINAFQLNDKAYVESINEIINSNLSCALVYFGVNHRLQTSTYPLIDHITRNLIRPAFFFATPEWYDSNRQLHLLWIDKDKKEDD